MDTPPPSMTPDAPASRTASADAAAHRAVTHLLDRIQNDADLAHLLGFGTTGFRLLCEAEALRLGVPLDDVMARRVVSTAKYPRRFLSESERGRARRGGP